MAALGDAHDREGTYPARSLNGNHGRLDERYLEHASDTGERSSFGMRPINWPNDGKKKTIQTI